MHKYKPFWGREEKKRTEAVRALLNELPHPFISCGAPWIFNNSVPSVENVILPGFQAELSGRVCAISVSSDCQGGGRRKQQEW